MLKTILNSFKIPEVRNKILFTLFIILLFRLGAAIPIPFTDASAGLIDPDSGSIMNYLNMMTGDAFNYGTLFAMSITPYINSSIIVQLLTVAIPKLEELSKDGETGKKKIAFITRIGAIIIAVMQSIAYLFYLRSLGYLETDAAGVAFSGFSAFLQGAVVVCLLTAASTLLMWLGEEINKKGIGNGISIILFAGIISRIPTTITYIIGYFTYGGLYYLFAPIALLIMIGLVVFIVWVNGSERRIPIVYAKRVVGRKMYGGQNTHMPIKVNMSGVMPIIFASSILSLPPTIQMFFKNKITEGGGWDKFLNFFSTDNWLYALIYFVLIILFAYFYATIQYNPIEMANNLRKNSGSIPGIRPGKPTSDYIAKTIFRITFLGAILISVVAILPILFSLITKISGSAMNISLGGTSVIILVSVALETIKQLESQITVRHHKGFLS